MKVCQTINLLDDQFRLVTLSPGDEVPEWAVARVTNPDVIAGDDDFVEAVAAAVEAEASSTETAPPLVDTGDGYDALNKKDLQELLSKRELPTAGNKPELIERLREADKAAAAAEEEVDLWSLSVDELKAYAEKHEIDVEGADTSEELAAVIQSAQSE